MSFPLFGFAVLYMARELFILLYLASCLVLLCTYIPGKLFVLAVDGNDLRLTVHLKK